MNQEDLDCNHQLLQPTVTEIRPDGQIEFEKVAELTGAVSGTYVKLAATVS